jgi:tetratricopeptide (TPR) repeat protein
VESETVSELFYDVALSHKNQHLAEDGIRYARRSAEIARQAPHAELRRSLALSMLADLLRLTGDLEGALLAIREARANLEEARFPNETERRSSWCRVLGREGKILGAISGLSLNRPADAAVVLHKAFGVLEEWRQSEPENNWTRLLFGSLGRELADILRARDPERALAIYDYSLRRVREVSDNPEARRAEAELLAASTHALQRLKRTRQAGERVAAALRLLEEINDYPADRIAPHSAAYEAVRASGHHLSETGQTEQALKVYEDLLGKVIASQIDAHNDLRHALALSDIYGSVAALHGRAGRSGRAQEFAELQTDLWRRWDRKLPNNGIVRRQLASARTY